MGLCLRPCSSNHEFFSEKSYSFLGQIVCQASFLNYIRFRRYCQECPLPQLLMLIGMSHSLKFWGWYEIQKTNTLRTEHDFFMK